MRRLSQLFFLLFAGSLSAQQFYVSGGTTVSISDEADLVLGGHLENNGQLNNLGTLTLNGNWVVNNMFNGMAGRLIFKGLGNQTIEVNDLQTSELTINSSGMVSYLGDQLTVMNSVDFQNGVLVTAEPTLFTLMPNTQVSGGSDDSYFQGRFSYRGAGTLTFPVGYQGLYAPIIIQDVTGTDQELTVYYENPNTAGPNPADLDDVVDPKHALLGVSELGLWRIQKTNGSINSELKYEIHFTNENILLTNDINTNFDSLVIAYSDAPGGTYYSLGVVDDIKDFNGTSGIVTSEDGVPDSLLNPQTTPAPPYYLAIAVAPRIDPEGLFYLPEVFSPNASAENNQRFKIFGEKISENNFLLEIYNNFGVIVYSTNSFAEAEENGWDGTDQRTKLEQPPNTYYYFLRLEKENGEKIPPKKGVLLLIR